MNAHKRSISISSSPCSTPCSSITTASQLSRSSSRLFSHSTSRSITSLSDVDDIITANTNLCTAVRQQIEARKLAISQLELLSLKKELRHLQSSVKKIQSDLNDTDQRIEGKIEKKPPIRPQDVRKLKEKLKEAKKKAKAVMVEKEEMSKENFYLKKVLENPSLTRSGSCGVF